MGIESYCVKCGIKIKREMNEFKPDSTCEDCKTSDMNEHEALDIASDFQKYLRKGDEAYIKKYTKEKIKCALSLVPHSLNSRQWYKEMERHIENPNEDKNELTKQLAKLAFINPNRRWVIKELDRILTEWEGWSSEVDQIVDQPYDRNTQLDVFKDGETMMQKHEILQSKTATFLDHNISNHGFVTGLDGSRCDRTDLRLKHRVKHRIQELRVLRACLNEVPGEEVIDSDIRYEDVLLSIFNRRYINEIFPNILKDNVSHRQPVSLIMIDIDKFGLFNKTYSLTVGDDVLKITGNLIKEAVSEKGKVARYGGEEIGIILPNYDIEEAISLAERIRKSIEQYNFNIQGKIAKITISAGVSCCLSPTELKDFIEQADNAVRISKSKGRNQVNVFNKEQSLLSNELVIIESVKDKEIKDYAKMALEALKGEKLEEFAKLLKLAFDKAFNKWKEDYQKKSEVSFYRMTILELIQNNILNFNLVEYTRFEALLPYITWFENGSHQFVIRRTYELESDKKSMEFCLKFFLEALIHFKNEVEI